MSLGAKMRELEAAMEEQRKAVELERNEMAAKLDAAHAKTVAAMADGVKLAETIAAAQKDLEAERARVKEAHEAACKEIGDLKAALGTEKAKGAEVEKKLGLAIAGLANPAFADAARAGLATPLPDGGQAKDEKAIEAKRSYWAEHNAIQDPAQKSVFWNKFEKELRAEQKAVAEAEKKAEQEKNAKE